MATPKAPVSTIESKSVLMVNYVRQYESDEQPDIYGDYEFEEEESDDDDDEDNEPDFYKCHDILKIVKVGDTITLGIASSVSEERVEEMRDSSGMAEFKTVELKKEEFKDFVGRILDEDS